MEEGVVGLEEDSSWLIYHTTCMIMLAGRTTSGEETFTWEEDNQDQLMMVDLMEMRGEKVKLGQESVLADIVGQCVNLAQQVTINTTFHMESAKSVTTNLHLLFMMQSVKILQIVLTNAYRNMSQYLSTQNALMMKTLKLKQSEELTQQ